MKKFIAVFSLIILTVLQVNADDEKFINALRNCSNYAENGNVTSSGMDVMSQKKIYGWEGDKCVYKETIKYQTVNAVVSCKFSQPQLDEITSVMKAYNVVQKYSGEDVDTSSLEAVQNNPVVKVWNKYLQNDSVCSMTGL